MLSPADKETTETTDPTDPALYFGNGLEEDSIILGGSDSEYFGLSPPDSLLPGTTFRSSYSPFKNSIRIGQEDSQSPPALPSLDFPYQEDQGEPSIDVFGTGPDFFLDGIARPSLEKDTPFSKKKKTEERKKRKAEERKKRKDEKKKEVTVADFKTVATRSPSVRVPTSPEEVQQCVVDALATVLPLDAKVMIFGYWHSIILVGVLYRHDNLCWIILNRTNLRLYLLCHFVSDGIHLFESIRYKLNVPITQVEKKWNRQGVPEVLCIFQSLTDFNNRNGYKMNHLPKEILKYNRTEHSFHKAIEFLRGVGSGGDFLQRFSRTAQSPPGFNPIIHGLTEATRGWKVFNPTRSLSRQCIGGKRRLCCAEYVAKLEAMDFKGMDIVQQAITVVKILPSRLDDANNKVLRDHYSAFIFFVYQNQELMFTPSKDHYL